MKFSRLIGNILKNKVLLFAYIGALIIYWPSLKYYFFQDDWFHLTISQASNIKQFLSLFAFRTDIIAWRPLSKQLFFFLNYHFFGLNPFPYHLVIFLFFGLNICVLYLLIKTLTKNKDIASLTAFFYATSSIHFISLSWISAGEYVIGTFFWLLSALLFSLYIIKNKTKYFLLSFAVFILCIMSTELALTLPAIFLSGYVIYLSGQKTGTKAIKTAVLIQLPYLLVIVIYLILRFIVFPLPASGNYQLTFNLKFINTFLWYVLWTFNIPEVFKYQIYLSKLQFFPDPTFVEPFKQYLFPFVFSLICTAVLIIYLAISNFNKTMFKYLVFAYSLFLIAISPVLFLPTHTFPHYLSIASISVYTFLAYVLSGKNKKMLVTTILALWFVLSIISISFSRKTHWVPSESAQSKTVIDLISKNYPKNLNEGTFYILPPDNNQNTEVINQSLMGNYALSFLFKNQNIKTRYVQNISEVNYDKGVVYIVKL